MHTPPTPHLSTSHPYPWPHDSSLHPSTTALLILDMQRDTLTSRPRYRDIIPPIVSLLSTFRRAGFPVFHARRGHARHLSTVSARDYHRSKATTPAEEEGRGAGNWGRWMVRGQRGHDIVSELCPLPNEPVVDRAGVGAFGGASELEGGLRGWGVRNLVVCGVSVEGAVNSTVREASERGFDCLVVEDAVEGASDELRWWGLEAIRAEGGVFGVTAECCEVIAAVETWTNA
ncbi:Isochorismatase hydrolase [Aaosphaeria arxii CBS 175.79]|uniref:Isochorismatase hydrolase n=1 Tax=Aaosphaeria arxii CBS 175.79 TaxID=1450172 RepID=A0A6A5XQL8_9PLEO|nr:Isochorismatase hydrolase [Aaosphaeria arxii CBS 175.79]KAF2014594.1 Isochorismatase hydrolase [Aaosphaeria arxii CBS 175.79]